MSHVTTRAVVVYDDPRQAPPPEEWQRHHESLIGRCLRGVVSRVTPETLRVELRGDRQGAYPVTVPWDEVGRNLPDLDEHFRVEQAVAVRLVSVDRPQDRWPRFAGALGESDETGPLPAAPAHVSINPESIRLGLLHELGREVVGIAAFTPDRLRSPLAVCLQEAGWRLVGPGELASTLLQALKEIRTQNPEVRLVVAGRVAADLMPRLEAVTTCNPEDGGAPPRVAGRPWTELPFVMDPDLIGFPVPADAAERAAPQLFVAAWAVAFDNPAQRLLAPQLAATGALFPDRPDLVLAAQHELDLRTPSQRERDLSRLERARPLLRGLPAHPDLPRDVVRAILTGDASLISVLESELAPVASHLLPHWADGRVRDMLGRPDGVRKLGQIGGLLGKLHQIPSDAVRRMLQDESDAGLLELLTLLPAGVASQALLETMEAQNDDLIDGLAKDPDKDLVSAYTPQVWQTLRDTGTAGDQIATYGPGYGILLLDGPPAGLEVHDLVELTRDLGTAPRELVRELIRLPPGLWGQLPRNRGLIKSWWRRQGDLDILRVIERIPDLGAWEEHLGTDGIRILQETSCDQVRLHLAHELARVLGRPLVEVIPKVTELSVLPDADELCAEPTASFLRNFFERYPFEELLTMARAGAPRRWIAYGEAGLHSEDLPLLFVASALDVLPQEIVSPERAPAMAQRLLDDSELGRALLRIDKAARLKLLPHVPGLAPGAHTLDLDGLAWAESPAAVAELALSAGIPVDRAQALLAQPGLADRLSGLRAVGPVIGDLSPETVATLLGLDLPVEAQSALAVLERERPGGIQTVARFGPELAPVICGPNGRALIDLLCNLNPAPGAGAWIRKGGHGAVDALREHGQPLLDLVEATDPRPRDTHILIRSLRYALGDTAVAARLYQLVSAHGIPEFCWPKVTEMVRARRRDRYILQTLFMKGVFE